MRHLLIGTAAAFIAFGAATPAFAQFGGSPEQQVDGAPADPEMSAPQGEDEPYELTADPESAYPDEYDDPELGAAVDDVEETAEAPAGKPGMDDGQDDYALYTDDAGQAGPGDPSEGVDAAEDGAGGPDEAGDPQTWQGEDGRTYCRRSDGTTGLIVGGGAGALIGRGIDRRGERGTGTIIGGIIGAVVGSAIERGAQEQNCR